MDPQTNNFTNFFSKIDFKFPSLFLKKMEIQKTHQTFFKIFFFSIQFTTAITFFFKFSTAFISPFSKPHFGAF